MESKTFEVYCNGTPPIQTKILIAAPVKQKIEIFNEFQKKLDELIVPDGYVVNRFYVVNNCPEIMPYIRNAAYMVYNFKNDIDKYHVWNPNLIAQMAYMRNLCMSYARERDYDYLLFVDTDEFLEPDTLIKFLTYKADIQYPKQFTQDQDGYTWIGVYELDNGAYWTDESYNKLVNSKDEVIEVAGGIGVTWISKNVLKNPHVDYSPIPGMSYEYLTGEDKYFNVRARVCGFHIFMNSYITCQHINTERAYQRYLKGEDPIDPSIMHTDASKPSPVGFLKKETK